MAMLTFSSTDAVAEARALATTLNLWLREQPRPEQAPPATVKFSYGADGALETVTVTLEEG
ncbi:hypothetical protein [Pseudomonas fluorescens]|uniref:hypothetical protein n=1 Tax=Pseudomonas fluorescens TaxID=294 RepID=UPI00178559C3|nr:hypothetical protein [Pseudomonas fluorescens]